MKAVTVENTRPVLATCLAEATARVTAATGTAHTGPEWTRLLEKFQCLAKSDLQELFCIEVL